jgi:hypothetical protein
MELVADPTASADKIAKRENCCARKINMTISLAFLVPDLVKAPICRRSGPASTSCSTFLRNSRTHARTESLPAVVSVRGNGIFVGRDEAAETIS